jgi:hypothetical protein
MEEELGSEERSTKVDAEGPEVVERVEDVDEEERDEEVRRRE